MGWWMMSDKRASSNYEEEREGEINLGTLWRMAWESKYLILLFAAIFAAAAIIYALSATQIYRAEAVVAEVHDSNMSSAASLANQLGGLASIAGINVSTGGDSGRQAQAVLQSRTLIEDFIQREDLLPVLNENSRKPPTLWRTVKQFREGVLKIREDRRTGLTTISIEWRDPAVAASWANKIVASANGLLRARAITDSSRNIEYLNKQIAKTDAVEVQHVLYHLIEAETKTLMLANARVEYAFTVVDPAVSPEIRIRPQRTLIVLTATMIGAIIGFMVVYFRRNSRNLLRGSTERS
jgi:uncharacterized protein involved in exopolysaccharide biosynthesis